VALCDEGEAGSPQLALRGLSCPCYQGSLTAWSTLLEAFRVNNGVNGFQTVGLSGALQYCAPGPDKNPKGTYQSSEVNQLRRSDWSNHLRERLHCTFSKIFFKQEVTSAC